MSAFGADRTSIKPAFLAGGIIEDMGINLGLQYTTSVAQLAILFRSSFDLSAYFFLNALVGNVTACRSSGSEATACPQEL